MTDVDITGMFKNKGDYEAKKTDHVQKVNAWMSDGIVDKQPEEKVLGKVIKEDYKPSFSLNEKYLPGYTAGDKCKFTVEGRIANVSHSSLTNEKEYRVEVNKIIKDSSRRI